MKELPQDYVFKDRDGAHVCTIPYKCSTAVQSTLIPKLGVKFPDKRREIILKSS